MTTYVFRDGEWVDKAAAAPLFDQEESFSYISDHMDPLFHHAALRKIDSKSEFRRETKAHGCIEVGTEKNYGRTRTHTENLDKRARREDIKKTIYQLRNGHG